ncbi:hypothetical protein FRC01_005436 [Tulasnella sp. 417]|nr:hypothetical protein FRC01_005436 [Tulasnella sp. 417]
MIPTTLRNRSRSSTAKAPKPSAPSLTKRITASIRPTPKPQPSLVRRATMTVSEFDSARWEKRMMKRIQRFQKDHPILMRIIGTGLCIAGGALTMPAVLGAFGIKLAVANAPMMLAEGLAAGSALPMTTANLAAGAKVLASSIALDIGGRLLAAPSSPTERGMFGFIPRRKNSSSSTLTESE